MYVCIYIYQTRLNTVRGATARVTAAARRAEGSGLALNPTAPLGVTVTKLCSHDTHSSHRHA